LRLGHPATQIGATQHQLVVLGGAGAHPQLQVMSGQLLRMHALPTAHLWAAIKKKGASVLTESGHGGPIVSIPTPTIAKDRHQCGFGPQVGAEGPEPAEAAILVENVAGDEGRTPTF